MENAFNALRRSFSFLFFLLLISIELNLIFITSYITALLYQKEDDNFHFSNYLTTSLSIIEVYRSNWLQFHFTNSRYIKFKFKWNYGYILCQLTIFNPIFIHHCECHMLNNFCVNITFSKRKKNLWCLHTFKIK